MKDKDAADFGNLAVAMGFLTREDLARAIVHQDDLEKLGIKRRLGEICLKKKILSREEVMLILRAQGKRVMTCTICRKSYNVHHYRPGETYACKHCSSMLAVPAKPAPAAVSGSVEFDNTSVRAVTTRRQKVPQDLVRVLSGYELVSCLGRGGMGTVYKARDTILNRWVAVKFLAPFLATNNEYVRRFFTEARNLQKLHHPNIVEAYDAGVAGDHKFLLMEFVDGEPLDRMLDRKGRLSERRALGIVRQVADALDYAWRHRIIHRDVKPHNVMLTKDRSAKLCDLGLSKDISSDITTTSTTESVNCSPPYASPEQAQGERIVDCRSDIYSLGVVLFQLVTGELPFEADAPGQYLLMHVTEPPPHPCEKNPDLSPRIGRLILRMLEKKPQDRPTAGDVSALLGKYLNGQVKKR